jgi:hypothetical protein
MRTFDTAIPPLAFIRFSSRALRCCPVNPQEFGGRTLVTERGRCPIVDLEISATTWPPSFHLRRQPVRGDLVAVGCEDLSGWLSPVPLAWERTTARLRARALYRLVARLGLGGRGQASVKGPEGQRWFPFRAANTQFHSLYLPQFAGGYEPETQLLIQILTGARGVFFDIGANWGHLSIALADSFTGEITLSSLRELPSGISARPRGAHAAPRL